MNKATPDILIFDDNSESLWLLEKILIKNLDANIIKAESGEAALELCSDFDFKLAILNVDMPGMNGIDLALKMRDKWSVKDVKVIFLTATFIDNQSIFQSYQIGAVDFLAKPYNDLILLSKVQVFLSLIEQKEEIELQKEQLKLEISEKHQIAQELKKANDELDYKVRQRTDELFNANEELKREIEERIEIEKHLKKAKIQADAANYAKSEFLATMSHELRTPLHGVLSFAKFGEKKTTTGGKFEHDALYAYFFEIQSSGQRLLSLLNDLLDLAKLESGKTEYSFKKDQLTPLVETAVKELSAFTKEKSIHIDFQKPDFDTFAIFDTNKIMQVITNLLTNAIKFSPSEKDIKIYFEDQKEVITISIKDYGVGIPEDELESVFSKFIQSTQTKTGAGGTGLGLTICRQIMLDHEGLIWAENHLNGGAVFRFQLPKSRSIPIK